jgi:transcriptional regulator with XRE-family HTH domain
MKNETALNVHKRIKEVRTALKMTQVRFSKAISISKGHIASIELAKRSVNDRHIKLVCATFGVNEDWMRSGKGEMFGKEAASKKYKKLQALFQQLGPIYQDHLLKHLNLLLDLQAENERKPE